MGSRPGLLAAAEGGAIFGYSTAEKCLGHPTNRANRPEDGVMEDENLPAAQPGEDAADAYEAPVVEDIDTAFGPTVTAAGVPSRTLAAPRGL